MMISSFYTKICPKKRASICGGLTSLTATVCTADSLQTSIIRSVRSWSQSPTPTMTIAHTSFANGVASRNGSVSKLAFLAGEKSMRGWKHHEQKHCSHHQGPAPPRSRGVQKAWDHYLCVVPTPVAVSRAYRPRRDQDCADQVQGRLRLGVARNWASQGAPSTRQQHAHARTLGLGVGACQCR